MMLPMMPPMATPPMTPLRMTAGRSVTVKLNLTENLTELELIELELTELTELRELTEMTKLTETILCETDDQDQYQYQYWSQLLTPLPVT